MSEVQSITNNDKAALFDWMNEASENNLTAYINLQHLFYDFHITSVAELLLCYSQKNHPKAEMFTEICSRLKPIPLKKLHILMKETQERSDQATAISTAVTRPSSSMEQDVTLFVVDLTGARTVCADLMMETTHIIPTNERSEGATTIEEENHNPAAEERRRS